MVFVMFIALSCYFLFMRVFDGLLFAFVCWASLSFKWVSERLVINGDKRESVRICKDKLYNPVERA